MAQYLWDLDIEDIPCGFASLYEEAKVHFPDGKIINSIDVMKNKSYSYWSNPVTAYNLLKITFNKLKCEAKSVMENKLKYDTKIFMSKLLELDISLYGLLLDWYFNDCSSCYIFRDPYRYFNDEKYYNFVLYFSPPQTEFEENYSSLKVINIEFDFSSYISSLKSLQHI